MRRFAADEVDAAAAFLRDGGVLAYPTEAVYGLGCDPDNEAAFRRLFALKRRPPTQGVLLIAADLEQLRPWIGEVPAAALARARATWPGPHTWVFPRSARVPAWVAGGHAGIALRVTAHPLAAALCRAFGGPLVSTSANRHGEPPVTTAAAVQAALGEELEAVLEGPVAGLDRPTPIRDALTDAIIRA